MILNTGSRTDIPAWYSEWFYNRVRAGYVLVRNPYYRQQVLRYELDPALIDCMVFCTKNPEPMFDGFGLLLPFETFWFVTITPYGPEIEPGVPAKDRVIDSFVELSGLVGADRTSWRYDPVFVSDEYSVARHIREFGRMAARLRGATRQCVVSFIDLYAKTRRNFPEVREVSSTEQGELVEAFAAIARAEGMQIHLCCEDRALARPGVDGTGCLSQAVLEDALGCELDVPKRRSARAACSCLLGADIGAYNTCAHGCRYCYANYDDTAVRRNMRLHDPTSPFLIGGAEEGDVVRRAQQVSWRKRGPGDAEQPSLF